MIEILYLSGVREAFAVCLGLWPQIRQRTRRTADNLTLYQLRTQIFVVAVVLCKVGATNTALCRKGAAGISRYDLPRGASSS